MDYRTTGLHMLRSFALASGVALSSLNCAGTAVAEDTSASRITDVRALSVNGILNLLIIRKGDLRAWQVPETNVNDAWKLKQTWHNLVYLWCNVGSGADVVIVTTDGWKLYHVGDWDKPLISGEANSHEDVKSVWRILPSDKQSTSSGIAVQLHDNAGQNREDRWLLYFTADGTLWAPIDLIPTVPIIRDFVRLGPGQIAIKGGPAGVDDDAAENWQLYEVSNDGKWRSLSLASGLSRIGNLKVFDYPNGVAVKGPTDDSSATWKWYYRAENNQFEDVHNLIHEAPNRIDDIQGYLDSRILGIVGSENVTAGGNSVIREYYYHSTSGKWSSLANVLPTNSKEVFEIKPFAGSRGIAFQKLNKLTGRHDTDWSAYYLTDQDHWEPLQSALKIQPSSIWNVQSYGSDSGFGIQLGGQASNEIQPFEWQWFAKRSEAWVSLQKLIPELPKKIWAVDSPDGARGIAIERDTRSDKESAVFDWNWFLSGSDGSWKEVSHVVNLPESFPDRHDEWSVSFPDSDDRGFRRNVLGVWNHDGESVWFLETKTGWISMTDAETKNLPQ